MDTHTLVVAEYVISDRNVTTSWYLRAVCCISYIFIIDRYCFVF